MTETTAMRTKRRYAHELYPHPPEGEMRPLAEEVPYLYARALGFDVQGTGWMADDGLPARRSGNDRLALWIAAGQRALIADALLRGLAGQEAWDWADERAQGDNLGEWIYERAVHYGVDPEAIKPYPCGPEPTRHTHYDERDAHGWRTGHTIEGRESECADCCEPAEARP